MIPPAGRLKFRLGPEPCEGECHLWSGEIAADGYGTFRGKGAHRAVYEWAYGPIPPGLNVHHRCQVKLCINPKHLEALTKLEHARRHWSFCRPAAQLALDIG